MAPIGYSGGIVRLPLTLLLVVGNFQFPTRPPIVGACVLVSIHCLFNTSAWSLQAFIRGVEGGTVFQQLPSFYMNNLVAGRMRAQPGTFLFHSWTLLGFR
jgi:hypothetical protein